MAAGTEAIALAESNETPELASLAAGVLSLCSAAMGDREACERAAALLRDVPEPERRAMGPIGLGYLALNQGRLDDADAHYRDVHAMSPIGQGLVRWEPEWIETLIRAGRREEAVAILRGAGGGRGARAADPAGHRAAEGDAGGRRRDGRRALQGDGRRRPRRPATGSGRGAPRSSGASGCGGRGAGPRPASTWSGRSSCCAGIGATVLAERATTELRAAGGVVGEDVASHQLLTPHELQVARLVVGGASNRDLAAKLFISPRTVEAHLTAIFRKLGVRNRRELAARAIDDPVLQP